MSAKSTITCDMEGVIQTMNEGALKMFGYDKEELIGKKRVSLFSPGHIVLQNLGTWLKEAVQKGEYVTETTFVRKNGESFGARIRISPTFKDGQQIGFCGVTEELEREVNVPISFGTKLMGWLVITRAPFLTAALVPCFIGLTYASGVADASISWFHAVLAILGVALLHLCSNVFNDYFDVKSGTDDANAGYFQQYSGGSRAIEMRLIDLRGTLVTAITLLAIAFGIGLYLTSVVGTGILVFGFAGALAGYFYTAPPLRLVARHGLGEMVIGLAFGPLITAGMYYVVTGQYSLEAFLFGIPTGLLTANILLINQVPDAESDATTGKNHLVVTFGKQKTPMFYALFFGGAMVYTAVLAMQYSKWFLFIPVAVGLVLGVGIIRHMSANLFSRALVQSNVGTIKLQLLVGLLFTLALLF